MALDLRKEWVRVVRKYMPNAEGPESEKYWSPGIETCPREKLRDIQNEKLEIAVRYVYENSPFFRRKFQEAKITPKDIKSVDDLYKVPIIEKKDLEMDMRENPPWGSFYCLTDDEWFRGGWLVFLTGGTTGRPLVFRRTNFDREFGAYNTAAELYGMGYRAGSGLFMFTAPISTHVYAWHIYGACQVLGIPVLNAGPPMPTEAKIPLLLEYKPTMLMGTPTYVRYLATKLLERGVDPRTTSVHTLMVAGEPGGSIPATRRRLARLWNARVTETFGCTESPAGISGACAEVCDNVDAESTWLHVWEHLGIPELVDPETNEPVPVGKQGQFVWTDLYSEAAPLLRFKLGDITSFTTEKCICGRTHLRALGGFVGRSGDVIHLRGNNIMVSQVESIIGQYDELGDEYQLVLTEEGGLDQLTVVVEVRPDLDKAALGHVREAVVADIKRATDATVRVELVDFGSLERAEFKSKRIKDLRPKD